MVRPRPLDPTRRLAVVRDPAALDVLQTEVQPVTAEQAHVAQVRHSNPPLCTTLSLDRTICPIIVPTNRPPAPRRPVWLLRASFPPPHFELCPYWAGIRRGLPTSCREMNTRPRWRPPCGSWGNSGRELSQKAPPSRTSPGRSGGGERSPKDRSSRWGRHHPWSARGPVHVRAESPGNRVLAPTPPPSHLSPFLLRCSRAARAWAGTARPPGRLPLPRSTTREGST